MTIKLQPFTVPNFVLEKSRPSKREDGWKQSVSWPLCEVSAEELSRMCDEFRAAVFAKAKKSDPKP